MKRSIRFIATMVIVSFFVLASDCSKNENQVNYETGFFPEDEIYNLEGLNTSYDDYNIALPQIAGDIPLMFSSNRNSQGSDFDIVSGAIYFIFSQIDAEFTLESEMLNETFYNNLEEVVNTDGDELGPYRFFNGSNGKEYFFYAEEDASGVLNLKYTSYSPFVSGSVVIDNPQEVISLNSSTSNDAYICFNSDISIAYFTSDRNGNYDIMEADVSDPVSFENWLGDDQIVISRTDSINSDYNDKCPYIRQNLMIFASDRAGGMGGYDLYYSVYRDDKWSSPVNMGPEINTEYNEYRPVAGSYPNYSNGFMLFSSDRPDGKGGYDLYFMGIDFSLLTEDL